RAYCKYIEQGRHEKKFSIRGFRILTVTLTDERATVAAAAIPERAGNTFCSPPDRISQGAIPIPSADRPAVRPGRRASTNVTPSFLHRTSCRKKLRCFN